MPATPPCNASEAPEIDRNAVIGADPLQTTTPERAAELKAQAISARRAARAPWQNAHVDRQDREREARRIAKEYRETQREAVNAAGKQCSRCAQTLPLDCFSPAHRDRPTARCKPCVAAVTRERYHSDLAKARSRTRNGTPNSERRRMSAERQGMADDRARRQAAELARQQAAERQRKREEQQRKIAERVERLTAQLTGTAAGERIASEERWDKAVSELRQLWLQSGDKQCISCKAIVPPTAMLPPGPANFYPGKCRPCVSAEYAARHRQVFGTAPPGPPLIRLLDGSAITVAELARRVREREQGYKR